MKGRLTKPLQLQAQWGFVGRPHQRVGQAHLHRALAELILPEKGVPPTSLTIENFCMVQQKQN